MFKGKTPRHALELAKLRAERDLLDFKIAEIAWQALEKGDYRGLTYSDLRLATEWGAR